MNGQTFWQNPCRRGKSHHKIQKLPGHFVLIYWLTVTLCWFTDLLSLCVDLLIYCHFVFIYWFTVTLCSFTDLFSRCVHLLSRCVHLLSRCVDILIYFHVVLIYLFTFTLCWFTDLLSGCVDLLSRCADLLSRCVNLLIYCLVVLFYWSTVTLCWLMDVLIYWFTVTLCWFTVTTLWLKVTLRLEEDWGKMKFNKPGLMGQIGLMEQIGWWTDGSYWFSTAVAWFAPSPISFVVINNPYGHHSVFIRYTKATCCGATSRGPWPRPLLTSTLGHSASSLTPTPFRQTKDFYWPFLLVRF